MTKKNEETKDVAVRSDELLPEVIGKGEFDTNALMEGVEVQLPRIKIIHQGMMFEIPDGESESGKMVQSFKGTILDMHRTSAYWSKSYDETGGGDFPECYSMNGVTPDPNCGEKQGETCIKCQRNYNNIEKVDGKPTGPYCKNSKRLHIVIEGSILPYRLIASVKNIRLVDTYVSLLAGASVPYPLIETEFSLISAKGKGGQQYSELVLKRVGTTHLVKKAADVQEVKAKIAYWKSTMRGEVDFDREELND